MLHLLCKYAAIVRVLALLHVASIQGRRIKADGYRRSIAKLNSHIQASRATPRAAYSISLPVAGSSVHPNQSLMEMVMESDRYSSNITDPSNATSEEECAAITCAEETDHSIWCARSPTVGEVLTLQWNQGSCHCGRSILDGCKISSEAKYCAVWLYATRTAGVGWHTSVVFDKEFEWSFSSIGGMNRKWMGEFSHNRFPSKTEEPIFQGYALKTKVDEIEKELDPFFPDGSYDVAKHNCNSFTDALLYFLLHIRLDEVYSRAERYIPGLGYLLGRNPVVPDDWTNDRYTIPWLDGQRDEFDPDNPGGFEWDKITST